MAEVTVTKENFEEEVIKSPIPVLIDFWASWCGPCMMLSPIVKEIADENEGKIKVCKVNVDEENQLASVFNVDSIPSLFVIKNGKITNNRVGYISKEDILDML